MEDSSYRCLIGIVGCRINSIIVNDVVPCKLIVSSMASRVCIFT